jgi:hypothetical protein
MKVLRSLLVLFAMWTSDPPAHHEVLKRKDDQWTARWLPTCLWHEGERRVRSLFHRRKEHLCEVTVFEPSVVWFSALAPAPLSLHHDL